MVAFSLAAAFQPKKKNSSLIGSSTLILGSEEAPTRTLEGKINRKFSSDRAFKQHKGSVLVDHHNMVLISSYAKRKLHRFFIRWVINSCLTSAGTVIIY